MYYGAYIGWISTSFSLHSRGKKQKMKILFLSHQWTRNSHLSLYSGFKRFIHFAALGNDATLVTFGPKEEEYEEDNVSVIAVKGGGKDYFFSNRMAISRKGSEIAGQFDVIHSIVSDCTYHLPKNKFTFTLHVLPGVVKYKEFRQNAFLFLKYHLIQKRAFRRARNIVCVSSNLLEGIPKKYRSKARFIPHGVDTEFWDPALAKMPKAFPDGGYVLSVGSHGMDRQLLGQLIEANPSVPFVFVGVKEKLGDHPNAHYLSKISDEELRDLYLGAALTSRPLLFATANNCILESMAMGKTILVNRIPGVTDYLTDDTCVFTDTLKAMSLANIPALKLDPAFIRRTAIEKFSWASVVNAYEAIY